MNLPASRSAQNLSQQTSDDTKPTVSLVVCTRNRPAQLRDCLQAVARLVPPADEVLVVDNTDGDAETKLAAAQYGARYVIEPAPGLSRARNRGMRESQFDVVAFLDDDAVPSANWLGRIVGPFADRRVAAVTGETLAFDSPAGAGTPQPSRSLSVNDPLWFEIANFGGLGYGTNMALRKVYCPSDSLFDERLGRGAPIWIAEESHAFTLLLMRGYVAVHVPAAIVLHPIKPRDVEQEAATSFAYWLLLFFDFPGHRLDLLRFLMRRLARKPLTWPRDPQGPGEIINSGLLVKLRAAFSGLCLYYKSRKLGKH